jgi:nucleoside-diphosphate-sugar epimerase
LAVFETSGVPDGSVIDENSPYHASPRDLGGYAWSKIEAEKLLFQLHRERGLPVTVLRPGIVIGELGPALFPHLGFRYRDRMVVVFRGGRNPLPLTYVRNTVDAIVLASTSEAAVGQSFNIVDDGSVTVRQYLERFSSVTGVQPLIVPLPSFVPALAATLYEAAAALRLAKPGATSRRQLRAKHHAIEFANTKLRTELGWTPAVPLDTGLDRVFQLYREQFVLR